MSWCQLLLKKAKGEDDKARFSYFLLCPILGFELWSLTESSSAAFCRGIQSMAEAQRERQEAERSAPPTRHGLETRRAGGEAVAAAELNLSMFDNILFTVRLYFWGNVYSR